MIEKPVIIEKPVVMREESNQEVELVRLREELMAANRAFHQ